VTEWVTIKVPAETRDKARDDPRTYEEILQAGLSSETPNGEEIPPGFTDKMDATGQELAALREELEGVGGGSVDEQEIANAVTSDLLASLPSKVADEMEGRMR